MKDINETESGAPANSMGSSSSIAGSGGIDTFDPLLKVGMLKRKKPLGSIVKTKSIRRSAVNGRTR
jgi:hypothetical protein